MGQMQHWRGSDVADAALVQRWRGSDAALSRYATEQVRHCLPAPAGAWVRRWDGRGPDAALAWVRCCRCSTGAALAWVRCSTEQICYRAGAPLSACAGSTGA